MSTALPVLLLFLTAVSMDSLTAINSAVGFF